eukprot:scaffold1.g5509.t1
MRLRRFFAIALQLIFVASIALAAVPETVEVLHINDNHARFQMEDSRDANCPASDTHGAACFGGFARQAGAISAARAAAAARGVDTLVLHAGDQFDVSDSNLAMFIGNASRLGPAPFPVLSCNLDASASAALSPLVANYTLVTLPRSGVRVGVVGLTYVDTPEVASPGKELRFLPYNETLPHCVSAARQEGADIVVSLTHIGYDDDVNLAASAAAADVDLIVGGHTHTLLYGVPAPAGQPQLASPAPPVLVRPTVVNESNAPVGPYPTLVLNAAANKTIPVVQASGNGQVAGEWVGGPPGSAPGQLPRHPQNVTIGAQLAVKSQALEAYKEEVVLNGEGGVVRNQESNLADFQCEAFFDYVANKTRLLESNGDWPVVCLFNGGSIIASISEGNVTGGDIITVSPYLNHIVALQADGPTLVAALNSGLSGWAGNNGSAGRFPQVGKLRYSFDPRRNADARLVAAQLWLRSGSGWVDLASYPGRILLVTNDYIATGGDFYTMMPALPVVANIAAPVSGVLIDFASIASPINIATDGRIDYDYLVKLLLIGDSGVGKSCLLLRFAEDSFTSSFITTIGIDFKIKKVLIDGKWVKLQIWDTAGQERFRTITSAYYRGAMGILLVYDVTDESSFNNIRNWMKNIEQHASESVVKVLVGNKSDMDESRRAVPYSRGQALADEFRMPFFETSAKANTNVDEVFQSIARDVVVRLRDAAPAGSDTGGGGAGGGGGGPALRLGGGAVGQRRSGGAPKPGGGCC